MNPLSYQTIESAETRLQGTQLRNLLFDDRYHHDDVIAESQYVFHQGNRLQQRWQDNPKSGLFCVAETGFGSGVNFLTTRQLWHQCTVKPAHLHYITTEQYLLEPDELLKANAGFSDFSDAAQRLADCVQNRRAGFHSFQFDSNVTLHLLLADAQQCLAQLKARVDAWFLDGFSPAKNPDMWSPELIQEMARLSHPETTFATYTAASNVRKTLQANGFKVLKAKGFGGKREHLVGHYEGLTQTDQSNKRPWAVTPASIATTKSVTIIGAGIGGLSIAHAAEKSGYRVTVIDRYSTAFSGASANPYALMMPYLTARSSSEALFYWRAFDYAVRFYGADELIKSGVAEQTKAFQQNDARYGLPHQLFNHDKGISQYPTAGYIDTDRLQHRLVSAVDEWLHLDIKNIQYKSNNNDSYWHLYDHNEQCVHRCETLIVAAGIDSLSIVPDSLPLAGRWGQSSLFTLPDSLKNLQQAQLNQGQLIPIQSKQQLLLSGEFRHLSQQDWFKETSPQSDVAQKQLKQWQLLPEFKDLTTAKIKSMYAGIRATTPDHLPLCGPLIKPEQFKHDYADLHHGRHWQRYPTAATHPNLYVLTGLGSRGFTSAPLLAHYLMAMINAEPLPLENDLGKIVHPNRFLYRQLKKPPL